MENVTIDLNDEGEIDEMFLQTSDIEDVFAFYDMACRGFDPDINGLLLLPDATGLKGISTTYKVVQYLKRDETLYKKFIFNYELEGVIQLDEVVYAFSVVIQPVAINEEQFYKTNLTNPGYEDTFVRYICADGDKIITQPCQYTTADIWRNPHNDITSVGGGIYYPKTEGNPYAEDMTHMIGSFYHEKEYYFLSVAFSFYDGQVMTDEEVFRSVKSIMETLQNSFVVYDYEHYKHQFDNEAEV